MKFRVGALLILTHQYAIAVLVAFEDRRQLLLQLLRGGLHIRDAASGLALEYGEALSLMHGATVIGQVEGFLVLGADFQAQTLDGKRAVRIGIIAEIQARGDQVLMAALVAEVIRPVEALHELVFPVAVAINDELLEALHVQRIGVDQEPTIPDAGIRTEEAFLALELVEKSVRVECPVLCHRRDPPRLLAGRAPPMAKA